MVLYHSNGRVVMAHERHLERQAANDANRFGYEDQAKPESPFRRRLPEDPLEYYYGNDDKVYFRINAQNLRTLYARDVHVPPNKKDWTPNDHQLAELTAHERKYVEGLELRTEEESQSVRLPDQGINKEALWLCSSYARQFFKYGNNGWRLYTVASNEFGENDNTEDDAAKDGNTRDAVLHNELPLPIEHPRRHYKEQGGYGNSRDYNAQMAFIERRPLEKFIIPWLKDMTNYIRYCRKKKILGDSSRIPDLPIPDDLLEMIELYGACLQLGLPKFKQQPLIKRLCKSMYQRQLQDCHLEALENYVARFHSDTVAILDPVLNHFIGSYPLRSTYDRTHAEPENDGGDDGRSGGGGAGTKRQASGTLKEGKNKKSKTHHKKGIQNQDEEEAEDATGEPAPNVKGDADPAKFLDYEEVNAGRKSPNQRDKHIIPPRLAVLGHSIRNWSGVRRNHNAAAAYTGYPLDIGIERRPIRHDASRTLMLDNKTYTYLLRNEPSMPGQVAQSTAPAPAQASASGRSGGQRGRDNANEEGGEYDGGD